MLSRRNFIAMAPAALAAPPAAAAAKLPTRTLGRTGRTVSILAFGCGSRFLQYKQEDQALAILNRALDLGINYFDTAQSYGNGLSEDRLGKFIKSRRDDVFLADKVEDREGEKALRSIEASLKRLQTDHFDLLHIHSLTGADDLRKIEAPDGVLKVLYKLRDQKVARAIGVTCHASPTALALALERHDFDCTQMALNAAMAIMGAGMRPEGGPAGSFQTLALPLARRKNLGVIAMKIFAQEKLLGAAPNDKLLRYAMSLPVAAAVVGMPKPEHLEANVAVARNFEPLPPSEMNELSRKLSAQLSASLHGFFRHHADC